MEISANINTPHNNPDVRGQNDNTTINLFLSNILKDCDMDIDKLWYGMNFVYLTEFICRDIHIRTIDRYMPLCMDRSFCPIVQSLNKSGFHYNDKLILDSWGKTHKIDKLKY